MKHPNVFLFPVQSAPNGDVYDVVDIETTRFLGMVGIAIPASDGFDAVYSWNAVTNDISEDLFESPSDAAEALADFVSEVY